MNRRLLNILQNLFITFFQKFNSIIANLATNKNFENMQLQPIPIEVKKENYYSK